MAAPYRAGFGFACIRKCAETRRARASCASVAGGQSGSERAAAWRFSSLMASKARQSVFGGLFARSLNFVVLPLAMPIIAPLEIHGASTEFQYLGQHTGRSAPARRGGSEHASCTGRSGVPSERGQHVRYV